MRANLWPMLLIGLVRKVCGQSDAARLFEDKLSQYNKLARPVWNSSLSLQIQFKLKLLQVLDVHEKNQVVTLNGWLIHVWHDYKLTWNPADYGGVGVMHIPAELIWLPDIILYNNADGSPQVTTLTKAHVYFTGKIVWEPPVIYNSMCQIAIEWFPFDEQHCELKFGSWTYYGSEVDMIHLEGDLVTVDFEEDGDPVWNVERGIDISEFQESVEWDLMTVKGTRHAKRYPCCNYPFVDITYYVNIRRKTLFYTINLITPCVAITFLTSLVFYLPSGSNNKITLCVSVLVSLTVFLLLLIEIIPPTSLVIPLIGRYLLFTMCLVSISVCVTVVILNIHYRTGNVQPLPHWARIIFLKCLPKFLFLTTTRRSDAEDILTKDAFKSFARAVDSKFKNMLVGDTNSCGRDTVVSNSASLGLEPTYVPVPSVPSLNSKSKLENMKMKACINICYIAEHMRWKELEEHLREDWKFVAMVIDRLFLVIFSLAITIGTGVMIFRAPILRDTRPPVTELVQRELAEMHTSMLVNTNT